VATVGHANELVARPVGELKGASLPENLIELLMGTATADHV